jgi:hypothetical protein
MYLNVSEVPTPSIFRVAVERDQIPKKKMVASYKTVVNITQKNTVQNVTAVELKCLKVFSISAVSAVLFLLVKV